MKVKLEVLGKDELKQLLSEMAAERDDDHGEVCSCVDCTAKRIAADPDPDGRPSEEIYVELILFSLKKLVELGEQADEAIIASYAKMTEMPVRPDFDNALLQWRVDEYNARTRAVRTLASLLPESRRPQAEPPSLLSWEQAIENLAATRSEIMAAVAKIKAQANPDLAQSLEQIVEAARANGKTDEEITAVLRNATEKARESVATAP